MKAMLVGFVAIAVIAVGADYTLDQMGWSAQEQGASPSSVRLD
ncbi:hypothetical protein [Marivita sp.]|nr:hypothetical protein [Marivita sp.]